MSIYGHDFRIWKEHIDNQPDLVTKIEDFFKRNIIYLVVGLDSTFMEGEKPHYHVRFLSGNPKRTIENRKLKFVETVNMKGLKGFTHTTSKNGSLETYADMCQYLGYALKEQVVKCDEYTLAFKNKNEDFNICFLKPYAEQALLCKKQKIERNENLENKDNKKKQLKDEILEYIKSNIGIITCPNDDTVKQICIILIQYQRENDVYIMNNCMTRYAHIFIQKYTSFTNEQIYNLRNVRY